MQVTGISTFIGGIVVPPQSSLTVGNIGIHSNKIETLAGGGNPVSYTHLTLPTTR